MMEKERRERERDREDRGREVKQLKSSDWLFFAGRDSSKKTVYFL